MVGQNIGKYRVLDRVGRGGMGTVFRALDEILNREVAIKILNAELNDPEVARRFRAEAVTVARLNHPGIATIFELFQHDGQWMMVMEFVRGETLEHMVERLGPLSPQRAADLCMQALAALSHAHRMGVVHRDLKPANLMITESGAVKIMDFGIARVAGSEHLTHAGFLMGTPAYMAPEQVTGGEIDARTDLYAIGVVFYYLVTARLPFKGDNPIAMAQSRVNDRPTPVSLVREGLPTWIEPLVDRALSKPAEDRFQSADQFREALRRGLAGLPMETQSGMSIPPELVATFPPGVMSLPGVSASSSGTSFPGTTPPGTLPPLTTPPNATAPATSATSARLPVSPAAAAASKELPIPKPAGLRTSPNLIVVGLGALALVLAVLLGVTWLRSHRPPTAVPPVDTVASTPAPPTTTPTPPPAESNPPAVSAPSPTASPPAAAAAAGTPTPTVTPAAGLPLPPGSTTPGSTPSASPTSSPSPAGGATPAASATRGASPANDLHVAFNDVKYIHVRGDKGDDEDAAIHFVGGMVSMTSNRTGATLASESYNRLVRATYVHAKNPKWDPSLSSPRPTLDLSSFPTFWRGTRHWLVLQSRTEFMILRLDDSSWRQVLETFEVRTGLKVDRPVVSDK